MIYMALSASGFIAYSGMMIWGTSVAHGISDVAWNSFSSVQLSRSVVSDSLRPMNRSTPGLPVHHQLPEFTQTHAHRVGDAIQPSHPLSSPSPPAPNSSQHQGLSQWVSSSHEVDRVLEFQLQHQELLQLPLNQYLIPCSWEQRCASHSWVDKDRNRPNNILG